MSSMESDHIIASLTVLIRPNIQNTNPALYAEARQVIEDNLVNISARLMQ